MKLKWITYFLFFLLVGKLFSQDRLEVFFDFNQSEVNNLAQKKINSWITENPNMQVVRVHGYCDWVGSNAYNDSLSMQRVRSVVDYLKNHQIPIDEAYFEKGFGKRFEQSNIQDQNRKVIIYYKPIQVKTVENNKEQTVSSLTIKMKDGVIGEKLDLEDLIFKNNSAIVVRQSIPVLDELVCILKENPTMKIQILGHICCKVEGDLENLSLQRARTVFTYLLRNKINRNRISYQGMGTSDPKFPIPEKNVEEEFANRRVEIIITEK